MAIILSFILDNIHTIILFVTGCLLLYWYSRKPANTPPGPTIWPLVGNYPTLIIGSVFRKELKHELMMRLYMEYGTIFSVYFGNTALYVLNDATSIREAFQRPELNDRALFVMKTFSKEAAEIAVAGNGDIWAAHRRFSISVFRNAGVGTSTFDAKIAEESGLFGDAIENMQGQPFNPKELLMKATSNIVCAIVLGKRFEYDDQDFCLLLRMIAKRAKLIQQLAFWMFLPLPLIKEYIIANYAEQFNENLTCTYAFFRRIIRDHEERLETTNDCQDFIDLYLAETIENRKIETGKKDTNFKEQYLEMLIDAFLHAGTDTSSTTLGWCLLRMVENTNIQHQIRDEIIASCGKDRLPVYSDRSKMPFTEAFLLEVQRLHTVLPLGVAHQATKTTTVQGYTIPKGTLIAANLWAVHHDPSVWNEPDEFKPIRFLDKDGKITNKDELIPFGAGRRSCIGDGIAKMELFILLTHLVRRFQFTSSADPSTLTFKGIAGMTYSPPSFCLSAEKR